MESALYGIFTLVGFVSEISLVRCAHSFDFRYFTNSWENPVRTRFPWSNLYKFPPIKKRNTTLKIAVICSKFLKRYYFKRSMARCLNRIELILRGRRRYWLWSHLCTCIIILGTFLCRSLQNKNVNWGSSVLSGDRKPLRLIFIYLFFMSDLSACPRWARAL